MSHGLHTPTTSLRFVVRTVEGPFGADGLPIRVTQKILQQLWNIIEYNDAGKAHMQRQEWRDVPIAAEEQT